MPHIAAIDMRLDVPERGNWSRRSSPRPTFRSARPGEQTLVLLNRRGFAPLSLCRSCGHQGYQCPDCSAWMVEHRFRERLDVPPLRALGSAARQRSARKVRPIPKSLTAVGPGIERIAEGGCCRGSPPMRAR